MAQTSDRGQQVPENAKTQRIASIVKALQTQGEQLTDDDLQQIQLKTDPLLAVEGTIHVDAGSTHIHVSLV